MFYYLTSLIYKSTVKNSQAIIVYWDEYSNPSSPWGFFYLVCIYVCVPITCECIESLTDLQITNVAGISGQWTLEIFFFYLPPQCWDYKHVSMLAP